MKFELGYSGGAVLNRDGEIIGVAVGTFRWNIVILFG